MQYLSFSLSLSIDRSVCLSHYFQLFVLRIIVVTRFSLLYCKYRQSVSSQQHTQSQTRSNTQPGDRAGVVKPLICTS